MVHWQYGHRLKHHKEQETDGRIDTGHRRSRGRSHNMATTRPLAGADLLRQARWHQRETVAQPPDRRQLLFPTIRRQGNVGSPHCGTVLDPRRIGEARHRIGRRPRARRVRLEVPVSPGCRTTGQVSRTLGRSERQMMACALSLALSWACVPSFLVELQAPQSNWRLSMWSLPPFERGTM